MNNFKIGRLLVKNFKSYTKEFLWNFKDKDLILLDGPNGFGKTTIFDAIEIALTGTISRLKESKIIDNKIRNKNMLISTNGSAGAPAFVILELISCNRSLVIGTCIEAKKGPNKDWSSHISRGILNYWPENLTDIENEIDKVKGNISEQLQTLLSFKDLNKMFNVFNYIQQEENLHFLKLDEKSRFKQIDHLFGIDFEKNSLNQLERIKNTVSNKIAELKDQELGIKNKLESIITDEVLHNENLLSGKTIAHPDIQNLTITQLEKYKESLNSCRQIFSKNWQNNLSIKKKRYQIRKLLKSENQNSIKNLLIFSNVSEFSRIESLRKHIKWVTNTIEKCSDYTKIIKFETSDYLDISEDLLNTIKKHFKAEFEKSITAISDYNFLLKTQETTERTLLIIKKSRETLIKNINKYHGEEEDITTHSDNKEKVDCPLCGKSYNDLIELNQAYIQQNSALEKFQTDSTIKIHEAYNEIIRELIFPTTQRCKYRLSKYSDFNEKYKEVLRTRQISKESFDEVLKLKKWFDKNLPKYVENVCPSLFSSKYSVDDNYTEIRNKLEIYDNLLSVITDDDFESIKEKLDLIKVDINLDVNFLPFSLKEIINDIKYIEDQIKLTNSNLYVTTKDELLKCSIGISNYQNILDALSEAHKIYKINISRHEQEIAKKIQIPFYNISSKILQTRLESGMPASGIILEAPEKFSSNGYYRFCSNIGTEHDAWSTMSSGQLAGVIIAFMLSMNKVFPTGLKTLLIDDPIQSMDDINMASLIQLLREEFKDYQIIMSTHESRIANYVSYKYQISGLEPLAINLKNEKKFSESIL